MKNIVRISKEETVSSDYVGDNHSCILDVISSLQLKPNYYKLVCWYENEYSYACRVVDSIKFSEKQFMEKFNVKWVKPKVSMRQNILQHTDYCAKERYIEGAYGLEINPQVVCSLSHAGFKRVNKSPTRPSFLRKPFIPHNTLNTTNLASLQSKQKVEVLKYGCKVWHEDTAVIKSNVRPNRESFFQTCNVFSAQNSNCDCYRAKERLEEVKQEFSKMVDITKDLLRKSYSTKIQLSPAEQQVVNPIKDSVIQHEESNKSKGIFVSEQLKNLQIASSLFDSSDICKASTCTVSSKIYNDCSKEDVDSIAHGKEKSDFSINDSNVSSKNVLCNCLTTRSLGASKVETSKVEKIAVSSHSINNQVVSNKNPDEVLGTTYVNRNFKEHVSKTITTFIDGFSRNFSFSSSKHTAVNKGQNHKNRLVMSSEKDMLNKDDDEINRNLKVPTVHNDRLSENKADEACKPESKHSLEKRCIKKDLRQALLIKKHVSCNEDLHDKKYENKQSTKVDEQSQENSNTENALPEEIKTSKKIKKLQFIKGHKYIESHQIIQGDNKSSQLADVTKIENELCSVQINNKDLNNKTSNNNIIFAESGKGKVTEENSSTNGTILFLPEPLNYDNNINKNVMESLEVQCANTVDLQDNITNLILKHSVKNTLNTDFNTSPVTSGSDNDSVNMHELQLKLAEHGDCVCNQKENLSEENKEDQSILIFSDDNKVLQDKVKQMADTLHKVKKRFVSFTLEDTFIANSIPTDPNAEIENLNKVFTDKQNDEDNNMSNINDRSDKLNKYDMRNSSSAVNTRIIENKGNKPAMEVTEQIDEVKITRYDRSRSSSVLNTNTKQDIFDKLDSASASDSESSLHIDGKKSQVIHITDLTTSLEDLERLDKICRIVEISDELSDKLFSTLDKTEHEDNNITKKKWSFKDLCEKINLDDFCNQVFGK